MNSQNEQLVGAKINDKYKPSFWNIIELICPSCKISLNFDLDKQDLISDGELNGELDLECNICKTELQFEVDGYELVDISAVVTKLTLTGVETK